MFNFSYIFADLTELLAGLSLKKAEDGDSYQQSSVEIVNQLKAILAALPDDFEGIPFAGQILKLKK